MMPLRGESFWGHIEINQHITSFPKSDMTQVVEIIRHGRQRPVYLKVSTMAFPPVFHLFFIFYIISHAFAIYSLGFLLHTLCKLYGQVLIWFLCVCILPNRYLDHCRINADWNLRNIISKYLIMLSANLSHFVEPSVCQKILFSVVPCLAPPHPDHGIWTWDAVNYGTIVFQCMPGFVLEGYNSSTCYNGRWQRRNPICIGRCCKCHEFFFKELCPSWNIDHIWTHRRPRASPYHVNYSEGTFVDIGRWWGGGWGGGGGVLGGGGLGVGGI